MNAHDRLNEIEARANAATDGPWYGIQTPPNMSPDGWTEWVIDSGPQFIASTQIGDARGRNDAEFIAHAREDVPQLVAALRAVLAVHRRIPGPATECDLCRKADPGLCSECRTAWPCTSVRAITSALGGA